MNAEQIMRENFENKWPIPNGVSWNGERYVSDSPSDAWDDSDVHQTRWESWQEAHSVPTLPIKLEKWIEAVRIQHYMLPKDGAGYVRVQDLRALFDGKVLVPVDKITTVARDVEYSPHTNKHTPFLRISFAYDDYDSRDELAAMLAASQEQNNG